MYPRVSALVIRGPGDLWAGAPYPGVDLESGLLGPSLPYPGTESVLELGLIPAAERALDRLWFTSFTAPGAREGCPGALYESRGAASPLD